MDPPITRESLEKRPGILMVGSPNVGKRTLLSRLLSVDFEDASDSSSDVLAYGWTISTKYYNADVSVWMAHLDDGFSTGTLPIFDQMQALVLVFDMNELGSFSALKDWVSRTDIENFDILLCIGNKVDLVPGHSAHVEYRKRLLRIGERSGNLDPESLEYGISETEGSSLLGDEEPSWEIKRSCMEWCIEHNIEYIEACALNSDFDKCLSVDGDSQGVERLFGALAAHMWPGMVLKSGDRIDEPSLPQQQESSEEDSEYELEYEILSGGSADPWDDTDGGWVSAAGPATALTDEPVQENPDAKPSTSASSVPGQTEESVAANELNQVSDLNEEMAYNIDDLEQLMSEIGNMRNNLRLMPDFQRREMAAQLALKMAAMFGGSSGDEDGFD